MTGLIFIVVFVVAALYEGSVDKKPTANRQATWITEPLNPDATVNHARGCGAVDQPGDGRNNVVAILIPFLGPVIDDTNLPATLQPLKRDVVSGEDGRLNPT